MNMAPSVVDEHLRAELAHEHQRLALVLAGVEDTRHIVREIRRLVLSDIGVEGQELVRRQRRARCAV
jgi:hypothetical protein